MNSANTIQCLNGYLTHYVGAVSDSLLSYVIGPSFVALFVAVFYIRWNRGYERTRIRLILRVLFKRAVWSNASSTLDAQLMCVHALLFPLLSALAAFNDKHVRNLMTTELGRALDGLAPVSVSEGQSRVILTIGFFLAYEFASWLHHYLMHKLPMLWELHKVHHSATTLTPFTFWRSHPLEVVLLLNANLVLAGVIYTLLACILGVAITERDAVVVLAYTAYGYVFGTLQHSHLWIPFTGWAGRIFCSPAHHEIHHSCDPRHHDKNFGANLVVFDWMFGTLCVPSRIKPTLTFGVNDGEALETLAGSLIHPLVKASNRLSRADMAGPHSSRSLPRPCVWLRLGRRLIR
jgi:sterol desaturase/sphingolipid hydroxylase (fatty acid hydroxylase superfamily)